MGVVLSKTPGVRRVGRPPVVAGRVVAGAPFPMFAVTKIEAGVDKNGRPYVRFEAEVQDPKLVAAGITGLTTRQSAFRGVTPGTDVAAQVAALTAMQARLKVVIVGDAYDLAIV